MADSYHRPVMLDEVVDYLKLRKGGVYVDATAGGGGHSRAIAERIGSDGVVIAIDRDSQALLAASATVSGTPARFIACNAAFDRIEDVVKGVGFTRVDGVLYDLGVSSHQLDDSTRGFTFRDPNAPLDMRMSQREEIPTAAELLNTLSEQEMTEIFRDNADEKWAARIAKFVVERREASPYSRAEQLIETVKAAIPVAARSKDIHPATKVFQALRISVNDEFGKLRSSLDGAIKILGTGGRLVTIDYHSGEARIIKQFVSELTGKCICPPEFPECRCLARAPQLRLVTRKAVVPTTEEIDINPRARSAKLRTAEKLEAA